MERMIAIYQSEVAQKYPLSLVTVFNETSSVDNEELFAIFRDMFGVDRPFNNFLNLDEIHKFAYTFAAEKSIDEFSLLKKEDYNESVRSVSTTSDFFPVIFEAGERVQNIDKVHRSGILDKIFN